MSKRYTIGEPSRASAPERENRLLPRVAAMIGLLGIAAAGAVLLRDRLPKPSATPKAAAPKASEIAASNAFSPASGATGAPAFGGSSVPTHPARGASAAAQQRAASFGGNLGQRGFGSAPAASQAQMQQTAARPSAAFGQGATVPPHFAQTQLQPAGAASVPQPSAQDVIARVKQSVVLIVTESGSGTGFVVGPSQVATCAHVVEGERQITIVTAAGRQVGALVGASDSANDVAVLNCGGGLPAALALGDVALAREGDEVAVTGYPVMDTLLGLGYVPQSSTTRGSVSAKRTRMLGYGQQIQQLQTDALINPGNSGGPLYSLRDGSVLGLARSKMVEEQGIGFCSTVNSLRRLLGR